MKRMATEYEIENILAEKYDSKKKAVVYHVKWKDWPEEENTWETKEDLIEDGYEAALEEYEERKQQKLKTPTKKSAASRSSRSKTPVKRAAPVVSSASKKKTSKSPEKPEPVKTPSPKASPAKPTPRKESTQKASRAKKSPSPAKAVTVDEAAREEAHGSLKLLFISSLVMGVCIAIAQQDDLFTFKNGDIASDLVPLIAALLLIRNLAKVHSVSSRASLALLWVAFSRVLMIPELGAPANLKGISEIGWRFFFARAVGADVADREVLVVSILSWYMFVYITTSSALANAASLASVWAVVTTVERWTLYMSVLNFIEAVASSAVLVSRFTDEGVMLWIAAGLLAVSSVSRTVAPYL
jgi:hypothetical protein